MKTEIREPISLLDCFYSPDKNKSKQYVSYCLFDYYYYLRGGYDVSYFKISIEDVFDKITKEFTKKEVRLVPLTINGSKYVINLHELYSFLWPGNAYKNAFNQVVKEKTDKNINDRYIYQKGGDIKKFSLSITLSNLFKNLFELFSKNKIVVENHPSINFIYSGNKLLNNKIYNLFKKNKINKIFLDVWNQNSEYFNNDITKYGESLKIIISSILYLNYKNYKTIIISNVTGPQQQAALCYANSSKADLKVIQHGRYMVHHLPGVIQSYFFKNKNILFWEEEFLKAINFLQAPRLNFRIDRLRISNENYKKGYVLIATSLPMPIDYDIYYTFWLTIKEVIKKCANLKFRFKPHKMDLLTPKIIEFFSLKIDFIDMIDLIPEYAIILNSTIFYELEKTSKVFDFKHTSSLDDVVSFLNK
jgi:hypothetical protein